MKSKRMPFILTVAVFCAVPAIAQDMPADYKQVVDVLGKTADFKDGVLKVNIPRNDVSVTVAGVKTPTPFGFGGWIAMSKGTGGMEVMMGDLVLLQAEVNPVMSALLNNGLDVTALHNHFFLDEPRMFYMHLHGHGTAADLARKVKPALDLIGRASGAAAPSTPAPAASTEMDTAALAKIVGTPGEQTGAVYKITIGRADLEDRRNGRAHQREDGAEHMGRVRRHQRQRGDCRRRRDARSRSDACPQGAAPERSRRRRHSPSHDGDPADDLLPPLLGDGPRGQACDQFQGGSGPARAGQERGSQKVTSVH